jgi:hypothetical protein
MSCTFLIPFVAVKDVDYVDEFNGILDSNICISVGFDD